MQPLSNPLRAAERGGFGAHGRAPARPVRDGVPDASDAKKSRHSRALNGESSTIFGGREIGGMARRRRLPSLRGAVGFLITSLPPGALVSHAKRFSRTDELSSSCARVVGPGFLTDGVSD
jgi:hypothetical protein